jgi:hypothetical protein
MSGLCLTALTSCTSPGANKMKSTSSPFDAKILLEDSMAANWEKNWILDGEKATVEHRDGGLYFAAGTVTKSQDRVLYNAHHAVLWTRQVFEGDIKISYEMTRMDDSNYGTTLLYIQAQGIGVPPHVEDITQWNELRKIPDMGTYFTYMDLLSLSFRENLRCKRYPWLDAELYDGPRGLIPPMVDYQGDNIERGKTYEVEVEKRDKSLKLKLVEKGSGRIMIDHTWDTTQIPDDIEPKIINKGRIGLRHMSTRQFIYKDFKVEQLVSAEE